MSLLGDQLITSEVVAIVELVKNAFDADATNATVLLENVSSRENGVIRIEDNGVGMTLDTVLKVWFELGTEFRKTQRAKGVTSAIFNRPLLGEKGIGRLAAHRLGSIVEVTTKTEKSEAEVMVEVNWETFEQSKYLDEVPVKWMTTKPKLFTGECHGTRITIQALKKAWNLNMVKNLKKKLRSLQAPFGDKYNFRIDVIAPEFPEIAKEEKVPLSKVLETALYTLEGSIDESGFLTGIYRFKHTKHRESNRAKAIEEALIDRKDSSGSGKLHVLSCGAFNIGLHGWDLDSETLKETITREFYDREIKPLTGVRVFRDGFRVWPYGEPGNDWLNLDGRRVNNPTKCVSNNQLVGIVNLSGVKNPKLMDKTDREGIIANDAYEELKILVLSAINQFEIERRADRLKTTSVIGGTRKKADRATKAIDNLRRKMERGDDLHSCLDEVGKIKTAHLAEVSKIDEQLVASAGIGIAYLLPAHEISSSIEDLKKNLNQLETDLGRIGVGGRFTERLSDMLKIADILQNIACGSLELIRKKKDRFSLRSAIDSAIRIKSAALDSENVDLKVVEKEAIKIKGWKNLITICILNLLHNSIYWLSNSPDKRIQITIEHDAHSHPRIVVSDNGPGIKREDVAYVGEVFWTRKPHGTGLGLFICKKAMRANHGELYLGFEEEETGFLHGANVILRFSPEVEIR